MAEEDPKSFTPPPTGKLYVFGWMGAVVIVVALTAGLVLARDLWIGRQSSELERQYQQGQRVLATKVIHSPKTAPAQDSRQHSWIHRDADLREGFRAI